MNQPLVSVCIVTYQHSRFIAQAIDGALMQTCDFPFEILIGEDESTDGTREICLDYAQRHPDFIRVFLRSRSDVVHIDGLPRGSYNFRMTLREARGEFVALCEGDDFWTDPSKLQRQVGFLRANPDCVGCFHDAQLVDGDGQCLQESYFQEEGDRFTQAEVLGKLLSRQPTCSMVFRKSAFAEPLPAWFVRRTNDLYLDILITGHGSLGFIRRNMSAYRRHAAGIWSGQREAKQIIELILRYKLLLTDPFFLSRYKELILSKTEEFEGLLFTRADFGTETARLAAIVEEQSVALACLGRERDRLTAETKAAQSESSRASQDGQEHIDALTAQLARLAATSAEQTKHIKVLEAERDRLTAETRVAQTEVNRASKDGQKHIDALKTQLDQLAATSREQSGYVAILEKERHRVSAELGELLQKAADYLAVIKEQTDYIRMLEAVRDQNSGTRQ